MIVFYEILRWHVNVLVPVFACACMRGWGWDREREGGDKNTHCCAAGEFVFVCKLFKILLKQTSLIERKVIPYQF